MGKFWPHVRLAGVIGALLLMLASPSPVVRARALVGDHPRLLVTNSTLSAVKAKLASGGVWNQDFATWVSWADSKYDAALSSSPADQPYLAANYAFLWLTHPVSGIRYSHSKEQYGALARSLLLKLPTVDVQVGNNFWYAFPIAYDWANPLLTASDKATLVNFMKTIDRWSFTEPGINPFNSQVTSARAQKILSGLAVAGDGIDDSWAQATIARYPEYYTELTGTTRSESELGGEDGTTGQGPTYGFTYSAPSMIIAEEGWRTANGISAAAHYGIPGKAAIRRLPQSFLYTLLPFARSQNGLPNDRRYLIWKAEYSNANTPAFDATYQAWLTGLTGLMKNVDPQIAGLSQWLIDQRAGSLSGGDPYYVRYWVFWKFIMGDKAQPASPDTLGLPISRQFKDGKFVFRTGWENLNDTYITFTANEWMRSAYGMSPNYPGGFTIDRKGPQVIRQGHSGHDWGSVSAGPSNILLFVDTSRSAPASDYDDSGGQRSIPGQMRGAIDFNQNGPNDLRDTVRFMPADPAANRDADYVMADVTRAYSSTKFKDDYNTAKVAEQVRSMVYFRPANPGSSPDIVVIFDRATSTDMKFEKRWLFHTSAEPMVNGSETPGQPVRNGSGGGKWTYSGASRVTATNTAYDSNGRTFLTPLLPASRRIVKVGGPNSRGESWTTDSHEFETPFGIIHPRWSIPEPEMEQYVGKYRIEVIPAVQSLKDVFLNVVEVGDAGTANPTPAVALIGSDLVAARVGNRIAAFSRSTDSVSSGDFQIDQAGTYRIHLADLSPGTEYRVTVGGNAATLTASNAGTLYIERAVGAGAMVQVVRTGVVPPAQPQSPSNVRIIR